MSSEATKAPRAGSGEMFDAIAARYDLLNRILSLGMDQGWRRRAVEALALRPGARVLDLATGTADLAMAIFQAHPPADPHTLPEARDAAAPAERDQVQVCVTSGRALRIFQRSFAVPAMCPQPLAIGLSRAGNQSASSVRR